MRTKASVIIATVATLIGLADGAQVLAQRRTPPRDPKSIVLFNWLWYMGMLRGVQEIDAVATLELKATGTIGVGGQACTLTNYRVSVNYQTPGMRVQYTCTAADGQARPAACGLALRRRFGCCGALLLRLSEPRLPAG